MFQPVQLVPEIEEHVRRTAPIHVALGSGVELARDHIGYRCDSTKSYEVKLTDVSQQGELIREIVVAGRRIAVFHLEESVGQFHAFALQEARADQDPWEGLEHLGYVVENLDQCHQMLKRHEQFQVMPVKQVGTGHYLKVHVLGIEIELRDRPIEEG